MATRLKEMYQKEIAPKIMEQYGIKNPNAVPKIEKIVVNMGLGKALGNTKRVETAQREMAAITGQWPAICRARKSIANFKLRQGMPIGVKVTLRGEMMYEFFDRLINVVIPRVRDFRGLKKKFDGRGNYSVGFNDQVIFPEINLDRIEEVQGMNICVTISNTNDEKSGSLMEAFGFPFVRPE